MITNRATVEETLIAAIDSVADELTDPLMQRQFELEEEMVEDGKHRYWDRVTKARPGYDAEGRFTEGEESRTPASQCLLKMSLHPMREGLQKFLDEASKRRGRPHFALEALRAVDVETAAFLSLKRCLDAFSLTPDMTNLCIKIGRTLEDEVRLRAFEKQAGGLLAAIRSRFKSGNFQHHRRVLNALAQRHDVDLGEPWKKDHALRVGAKAKGKSFHVPDGTWTQEELETAVDELEANDLVHMYESFGRCDWDLIKGHIRYLAAQGVRHFYLDHLTALADPDDERASLEKIMEEMASIANELGLIFHYVSHLATPEGKSHEEGGRVLSKHFKGARAIQFWTHYMFGLERNKLADDPEERTIATLRCIKDRMTGRADGETLRLKYDRSTCRLNEHREDTTPATYDFQPEDEDDDAIPF